MALHGRIDPLKITNGFNYNDNLAALDWCGCSLDYRIYDTVRGFERAQDSIYGLGLSLISNKTDAESMVGLREFNDDGFTVKTKAHLTGPMAGITCRGHSRSDPGWTSSSTRVRVGKACSGWTVSRG